MTTPFEVAIFCLLKRHKESDDPEEKTQLCDAVITLRAAGKVSERDLGRVFMGFVSTEMRDLLDSIKTSIRKAKP